MHLQLTLQEQQDLLWESGDYFEILSGNISFTARHQVRRVQNGPIYTEVRFFFESTDPVWGTMEWTMCLEADIPNGPALLVIYKRGQSACAWGIVSMTNRAWSHVLPIDSMDLAQGTTKMKELNKKFGGGLLGAAGVAALATLVPGGLLALAIPSVRKKLGGATAMGNFTNSAEQIGTTARAFMFRIVQNAQNFWQDANGTSTSGKL